MLFHEKGSREQAGSGTAPTCVLSHSLFHPTLDRQKVLQCRVGHLLPITTGRWHHFRFRDRRLAIVYDVHVVHFVQDSIEVTLPNPSDLNII